MADPNDPSREEAYNAMIKKITKGINTRLEDIKEDALAAIKEYDCFVKSMSEKYPELGQILQDDTWKGFNSPRYGAIETYPKLTPNEKETAIELQHNYRTQGQAFARGAEKVAKDLGFSEDLGYNVFYRMTEGRLEKDCSVGAGLSPSKNSSCRGVLKAMSIPIDRHTETDVVALPSSKGASFSPS